MGDEYDMGRRMSRDECEDEYGRVCARSSVKGCGVRVAEVRCRPLHVSCVGVPMVCVDVHMGCVVVPMMGYVVVWVNDIRGDDTVGEYFYRSAAWSGVEVMSPDRNA